MIFLHLLISLVFASEASAFLNKETRDHIKEKKAARLQKRADHQKTIANLKQLESAPEISNNPTPAPLPKPEVSNFPTPVELPKIEVVKTTGADERKSFAEESIKKNTSALNEMKIKMNEIVQLRTKAQFEKDQEKDKELSLIYDKLKADSESTRHDLEKHKAILASLVLEGDKNVSTPAPVAPKPNPDISSLLSEQLEREKKRLEEQQAKLAKAQAEENDLLARTHSQIIEAQQKQIQLFQNRIEHEKALQATLAKVKAPKQEKAPSNPARSIASDSAEAGKSIPTSAPIGSAPKSSSSSSAVPR